MSDEAPPAKPHLTPYTHGNGEGLLCSSCGVADPNGRVIRHGPLCGVRPREIECITANPRPVVAGTRVRGDAPKLIVRDD